MDFERAAVIGVGTMGAGIAQVLARSGAQVWLVEPDDAQASRAQQAFAESGLADLVGRWRSVEALPVGLDVIIEAVPERADLKALVLSAAEQRRPRLLGTNTSALSITTLAQPLVHPEGLVGLHFFNPVQKMRLLEVVKGSATNDATVQLALRLAAQLDKEPIVVADLPGFATSRLGLVLGLEAMRMLEDGVAGAADIDKAMELGYRHPMGPLRLSDLVGLDVRLDIARVLQAAYGDRFAPPQILIEKVSSGELGQKVGQGFYRWDSPPSA